MLIRFTDWDLYAVAGVSSIVTIIKNLVFTIPVSSRLLHVKWYTFYPQVGISILSSGLIILTGMLVRQVMPVDSWLMFFLACAVIAVLGLALNVMLVLNKDERRYLFSVVKRKLHLSDGK